MVRARNACVKTLCRSWRSVSAGNRLTPVRTTEPSYLYIHAVVLLASSHEHIALCDDLVDEAVSALLTI